MAKEEKNQNTNDEVKPSTEGTPTEERTVSEAPAEKMVKIRIPKDRENKEPVWVRVNERKWLIQRGVEVEVPECVYEVLKHQEEMQEIIMAFEEANVKNA